MGVCGSTPQKGTGKGSSEPGDDVDGPVNRFNGPKEKNKDSVDRNSNQRNHNNVTTTGNSLNVPGNDERDLGLVPVGHFNQSSFVGLDIIDLDDNEEYLRAIQQVILHLIIHIFLTCSCLAVIVNGYY